MEFSEIFNPIKIEIGYVKEVVDNTAVEGVYVNETKLFSDGIAF